MKRLIKQRKIWLDGWILNKIQCAMQTGRLLLIIAQSKAKRLVTTQNRI